jgi:hypothetical protein
MAANIAADVVIIGPCAREAIEGGPAGGTIRYTCEGRGFGPTALRVETPRLAKIHTQGICDSRPFSCRAEAPPGRATAEPLYARPLTPCLPLLW